MRGRYSTQANPCSRIASTVAEPIPQIPLLCGCRGKQATLGLPYAVEALEGLLSEAVCTEMPAHILLDRLLDAERSGREERRVWTRLMTEKIPTGATLENFDFAFQTAIERSRIEALATGAWIRNSEVVRKRHLRPTFF